MKEFFKYGVVAGAGTALGYYGLVVLAYIALPKVARKDVKWAQRLCDSLMIDYEEEETFRKSK